MNVENDFLSDFDLFGKTPEIYYKGKSKKSSTLGIIFTVLYIILYIAFLIYKLVRMVRRIDVTFYDSYTFIGLPSIKVTNNEFYAAFGMGGMVDEQMYYLTVDYVSKVRVNGEFVGDPIPLETEICQLEKFGKDYQEIFADQNLKNYYCIKNVSEMVLEGYSNLERYSYFNVKFYPCVGTTRDGRPCYNDLVKKQFFTVNTLECKIQDNDLNPTNYKEPVIRRKVDMNSPVFLDLFQFIYSYFQIVNIETDEDLTGLNFFTDTIRKQVYTRYDESFIIASPLLYDNILQTGGPIADVTLQLAAKVLTEKRQYMQLIDVLGDVGGLMEILYSFLNIISSFITEILYDRSLINNLFSFDLEKKYVVFNSVKNKIKKKDDENITKNLHKADLINPKQKFEDIDINKDVEIFSKEKPVEKNTIIQKKNNNSSERQKIIKMRKTSKIVPTRSSKNNLIQFKQQEIPKENDENKEIKLSSGDNKNIIGIYNIDNDQLGSNDDSVYSIGNELKNVYINNWLLCFIWCTTKKKNVNKILFEEGSKIITERLDILNMFKYLYAVEKIKKKLNIDVKGIHMSDKSITFLQIYNLNNKNI